MSKAGDAHMAKIRALPCVVCLYKLGIITTPVSGHHVSVPADDFAVSPLCPEHHQGKTGVHGLRRRGFERMWKLDEVGLLALTNRAIAEGR